VKSVLSEDEVAEAINSAPKGQAHSVALKLIKQFPADIREWIGADLEEMAIVSDCSNK
jgi:hypothetical protein